MGSCCEDLFHGNEKNDRFKPVTWIWEAWRQLGGIRSWNTLENMLYDHAMNGKHISYVEKT